VVIFYLGLSEWGLLLTAAITPFLLITVQAAAAVEALERTLLEAAGITVPPTALSWVIRQALPHRSSVTDWSSLFHRHRGRK
jgi:hypothetical protein